MTTTLETQDAPPQSGGDEVEEIALPAGQSLEDFFAEDESDDDPSSTEAGDIAPATEEPATAAAAAPAPAPAEKKDPAKPEKKGDVRVALKKERESNKDLKERLKKATSPNPWERIEAQRQEARIKQGPAGRQRAAAPDVKFDAQAARTEAIKATEGVDTFAATAGATTEVALKHAELMFKNWQTESLRYADYQKQLDQEMELREDLTDDGEDFDEIMAASGILPMIQADPKTGQPVNPALYDPEVSKLVYGSANPPKKALKLARQRIEFLATKKGPSAQTDSDDDDPTTSIVPGHADVTLATPTAKADPAEARREGARQAIERVNEHATKPRGLRAFTRAGAPNQIFLNDALRARLDEMSVKRPNDFAEFCRLNPKTAEWWEDGD